MELSELDHLPHNLADLVSQHESELLDYHTREPKNGERIILAHEGNINDIQDPKQLYGLAKVKRVKNRAELEAEFKNDVHIQRLLRGYRGKAPMVLLETLESFGTRNGTGTKIIDYLKNGSAGIIAQEALKNAVVFYEKKGFERTGIQSNGAKFMLWKGPRYKR